MKKDYVNVPWLTIDDSRNEETGKLLTESLFLETNQTNENMIRWCLSEFEKEYQGRELMSAYQVVVHANDEYDAAMKVCGSWRLWKRIKENKALWNGRVGVFPGLGAALEEQQFRKASLAIRMIRNTAETGNVTAQKYLHELSKDAKPKGRKHKIEMKKDEADDKVVAMYDRLKK